MSGRRIEDFVPLGAHVVVRRDRMLKSGSIDLLEKTEEEMRPATGVVIAVGSGVEGIAVGDAVAYSVYGGRMMLEDALYPMAKQEEEWKVFRVEEIYGVWPGGGEIVEGQEAGEDSGPPALP